MSDYSYNYNMNQFSKAQRAYDNQMPPDDDDTRDCDECGDEYDVERDDDGDPIHKICEKCRKYQEDMQQ